jgi:hypothetical protein
MMGDEKGVMELTLIHTEVASIQENLLMSDDPLQDLMEEFRSYELLEAESIKLPQYGVCQVDMSEDQMNYQIHQQLRGFQSSLARLRFYLDEMDQALKP